MLKHALVALAFTLLATTSPAQTRPAPPLPAGIEEVTRVEGITEYRLKNGLQLLLVPDDSKPSTTVNVTYRVGSRYESYGETGMAHLLEHLLFKGTPTTRNLLAEFTKRGLRANGTHLVRPHQLLRHLLGERRQPALVPRLAGRRDDQQLHRPRRPRHRDDGRAQRDGSGREQPEPGAAAADDGRHVPVAQLRQGDDRRPRRRRERRHSRGCRRSTATTTSRTTPP